MLLFRWNIAHKILSSQFLYLMSQTQIIYHKLLVYCALILFSLFQQIIEEKHC